MGSLYLKKTMRGNSLCTDCGTCKRTVLPTKSPSSQATKSHAGKARSYKPQNRSLNETILPMR